jgi:glycosyltransferase
MSRIKIDAVAAPLSGHLYPVLLLLAPLLNDLNYEIRIFTGPQKLKVAEVIGFTVAPIMENQIEQGVSFNASKMGFQL